jgi:hypothetical protein
MLEFPVLEKGPAMIKQTRWVVLSVCAVLIAGGAATAETAKDILDKAIAAHGGADAIKKYPAGKATSKGKINIMGLEVPLEGETLYQLPDLGKNILKLDVGGQKINVVQVFNGGKVKVTANEAATPLSDAQKNEVKEAFYLQAVQNLVPLVEDRTFDVSIIENADKVNGNEVDGLYVKSKGHKDVKLFFDKKSHTLIKMERLGLNEVEKEVKQELYFSDHKKFDGILRPVKSELHMDGKVFMESEITAYKHLEKLDKKEFDISD